MDSARGWRRRLLLTEGWGLPCAPVSVNDLCTSAFAHLHNCAAIQRFKVTKNANVHEFMTKRVDNTNCMFCKEKQRVSTFLKIMPSLLPGTHHLQKSLNISAFMGYVEQWDNKINEMEGTLLGKFTSCNVVLCKQT